MAHHHGQGLFGRILRAFRSTCGGDDDAWADLSPWDLCVNSSNETKPPDDIPRVVSIAEDNSDMVSDLHTIINQTRGPPEQKGSFESDPDLSELFGPRRRYTPESKHKRRDSPPSQDYTGFSHGLQSQYVQSQYVYQSHQPILQAKLAPEQPIQLEKIGDDIPRNIYTRPRVVQQHVVRL